MSLVLLPLTPEVMRLRLSDAMDVYLAAMDYDFSWKHNRRRAWYQATYFDGWIAYGLFEYSDNPADPNNNPRSAPLVGISYGYRGNGRSWWSGQIRRGMQSQNFSPRHTEETLERYFELSEIHIVPEHQGKGWGSRMLHQIEASCREDTIILSTPEHSQEDNAACRLYRKSGYRDLLRNFYFPGDTRSFGVLIKDLPTSFR